MMERIVMARHSAFPDSMTWIWPDEPGPTKFPQYSDRRFLARIHQQYYGPLSEHSLPAWPLDWRIVNGRAVAETRAFMAEAQRRFNAARLGKKQLRRGRSPPVGVATNLNNSARLWPFGSGNPIISTD
jgi:hypothetical protein